MGDVLDLPRMKKSLFAGFILASIAVGAEHSAWRYHLPDTGIAPSYGSYTFVSMMGERHGGSRLGMQTYELTIPLSDPRQTGYGDWAINAQLDVRLSLLDTEGNLWLEHDEMYSASLPVTWIHQYASGNRLTMTVAPAVASDFGGTSRFFDVLGGASYTIKQSETLSYSIGVGASPRFAYYVIVPMVGFDWQADADWNVSLRFNRLSAMYRVNERLFVGPFVSGYNHTWMVSTDAGDKIFRFRSLVAGFTGEYDFSRAGQRKRIITASLGSTLVSTAQFCKRNASKEPETTLHYKPGLFVSLGVDFRF